MLRVYPSYAWCTSNVTVVNHEKKRNQMRSFQTRHNDRVCYRAIIATASKVKVFTQTQLHVAMPSRMKISYTTLFAQTKLNFSLHILRVFMSNGMYAPELETAVETAKPIGIHEETFIGLVLMLFHLT
jgi:hypothetical protein